MPIEIARVPALSDNYIWIVHDDDSGETAVVDPSVADAVLEAAAARSWRITQILNTHWHFDHVGGNAEIKAATGCTITAPAAEAAKIAGVDRAVGEGDTVAIGAHQGRVLEIGAHTAGHIAYVFDDAEMLFCGDTMFAMGCGRLFEGTPQMMFDALAKLMALPDAMRVYCGHEYTEANGRFALTVEPDNRVLIERMTHVRAQRAAGDATLPSTIELERATNPFARASTVYELARRRSAKDVFRG